MYVLHSESCNIQSASMDNFVKNLFLSTVTMENGEGYVPEIASGTLIIQWLLVHDWATVTLVSYHYNA